MPTAPPRGRCVISGRLWFQRDIAIADAVLVCPGGPWNLFYRPAANNSQRVSDPFMRVEILRTGRRELVPMRFLAPAPLEASASMLETVSAGSREAVR